MKWKRLGLLFDPENDKHFLSYEGFAQSPQVLEVDGRNRTYFSIRSKDDEGLFRSQVSYVDFDRSFSCVVGYPRKEVIPLGELGTFDEHGIFPFSPCRVEDRVYGYTCGWSRRVSVSVETATGLAISHDQGESFQKIGTGPVMTNSLNEPFLVGDSFVRYYNGTFHMWYIFGQRWIRHPHTRVPERVYKIACAKSKDGIQWTRYGKAILNERLGFNECQALPSVVFWDNKYHMVFCYRDVFDFRTTRDKAYRLGYAYSSDLLTWHRDDSQVESAFEDCQPGDWDYEMKCYPHFCISGGSLYLLYNGNDFGRGGFGAAVLVD